MGRFGAVPAAEDKRFASRSLVSLGRHRVRRARLSGEALLDLGRAQRNGPRPTSCSFVLRCLTLYVMSSCWAWDGLDIRVAFVLAVCHHFSRSIRYVRCEHVRVVFVTGQGLVSIHAGQRNWTGSHLRFKPLYYMNVYNRHLGLTNAPPPYLCFSSKRPFSLFIYYQNGQT